jgi:hypothetical protein
MDSNVRDPDIMVQFTVDSETHLGGQKVSKNRYKGFPLYCEPFYLKNLLCQKM